MRAASEAPLPGPEAPNPGPESPSPGPGPAPLRVLHVDPERGFSGGEVQVLGLIRGLARGREQPGAEQPGAEQPGAEQPCAEQLGAEQWLAGHPGGPALARAAEAGVGTVDLPMRGDLDAGAVRRLRRVLRELAPDVLHLHTGRATWIGALAAAGLQPRPLVVTTRRMDRRVKRNWRTRWIYRRGVDVAVAISPAVRECLLAGGVEPGRVELIWSSVDPAALAPSAPRERLRERFGLGPDARLLLAAGGLVRRKGLDVALEAFRRLERPEARFWIAGEGPERGALEAAIEAAGLGEQVTLLGVRSDVPDLLAAADAFVMPSRAEGLGIAALEALCCGCPAVASRVGGLGQALVDGESGLLVPPDDAGALAAALERVLSEPGLAERLRAGGTERVRSTFHVDRMVQAYAELYGRRLAELGRGAAAPSPSHPDRP